MSSAFLQMLAAWLAWLVGGENGTNGALAILFCLRNRIASGEDLHDILEKEFAERLVGELTVPVPDVRNPIIQQILLLTEGVFDNTIQDTLTGGATHWYQKPGLKRVAQVGALNLWK